MRLNRVPLHNLLNSCALLALLAGLSACGGGGGGGGDTGAAVGATTQNAVTTAATGSTTLSWNAPVARADGSSLSLSAIGGFRIYYGTTAGSYTHQLDVSDPAATSFTVSNIPVGTYYFVMTAYDNAGQESGFSQVTSRVIN